MSNEAPLPSPQYGGSSRKLMMTQEEKSEVLNTSPDIAKNGRFLHGDATKILRAVEVLDATVRTISRN